MATRKAAPLDTASLLAAGFALSEQTPLSEITLAKIARAAGVSLARVKTQYPDLAQYLTALQKQHLVGLRDLVIARTLNEAAGLPRVRNATLAFLDHCLEYRGLRKWLLQARKEIPALAEGLRKQNQAFILVIATEFQALHWPHPQAAARLYLAALQEAGRLEIEYGAPLPHIREALWDIARLYTTAMNKP